jgi:hypothetical protein
MLSTVFPRPSNVPEKLTVIGEPERVLEYVSGAARAKFPDAVTFARSAIDFTRV